jgi:hypothetical protein
MAQFLQPRVKETTTTTGTGTMQLLGAATGYRTFLAAFGNGASCYYMVIDGSNWEYGLGTINSSSQLARTLVIYSSSAGALITLAAGTKNVICAIVPELCLMNGVQTLTNNSATPSVLNGHTFLASNSSGTTITNFTSGIDGQELLIIFTNSNTTVQHNANIRLSGGTNFTGTSNDTMRLVYSSAIWYELSRAVNT